VLTVSSIPTNTVYRVVLQKVYNIARCRQSLELTTLTFLDTRECVTVFLHRVYKTSRVYYPQSPTLQTHVRVPVTGVGQSCADLTWTVFCAHLALAGVMPNMQCDTQMKTCSVIQRCSVIHRCGVIRQEKDLGVEGAQFLAEPRAFIDGTRTSLAFENRLSFHVR